jgi:hypothetical protein
MLSPDASMSIDVTSIAKQKKAPAAQRVHGRGFLALRAYWTRIGSTTFNKMPT